MQKAKDCLEIDSPKQGGDMTHMNHIAPKVFTSCNRI